MTIIDMFLYPVCKILISKGHNSLFTNIKFSLGLKSEVWYFLVYYFPCFVLIN